MTSYEPRSVCAFENSLFTLGESSLEHSSKKFIRHCCLESCDMLESVALSDLDESGVLYYLARSSRVVGVGSPGRP